MNRFDLVVINRVFQFSADSLDDSQVWISVLHAAISKFKPQEAKDGGIMSDPDKQGFILKQGHGPFAKFKERQVHVHVCYLHCQNRWMVGGGGGGGDCSTADLHVPNYTCTCSYPHF